ncbi:MAG: hypothetical protein Q9174_004778 [Haloplaca sp. 1 TL-2023]
MSLLDLSTCATVIQDQRISPEELEKPSFQNLPTEMQLQILYEAMPSRVAPVVKSSDTRPLYPLNNTPRTLLTVSKSIAEKARSVMDKEVYFVFDLDRFFWGQYHKHEQRNHLELHCEFFAKTQLVNKAQHIQRMRNFEIVIGARQISPWRFLGDESRISGHVSDTRQLYKEELRIVCDALTTLKTNIRHLIVRLPCLCSLISREAVLAEAVLPEILEPLRRLTVMKPVTIVMDHNVYQCDDPHNSGIYGRQSDPVHASKTLQMVKNLQARYGRLEGLPLSPHEETWRAVKMMNCPVMVPPIIFPYNVWNVWYALDRDLECFEERAQDYQEKRA